MSGQVDLHDKCHRLDAAPSAINVKLSENRLGNNADELINTVRRSSPAEFKPLQVCAGIHLFHGTYFIS